MFPRSVPYENVVPERDNIVTVGMPGLTSTRSQMARYTGGEPVTVLRNWADDPHDVLHELDKDKNRYSHTTFGQRVRRALRLWKVVVFGLREKTASAEETRYDKCGPSDDVVITSGAASAHGEQATISSNTQNGNASLTHRGRHAQAAASASAYSSSEPTPSSASAAADALREAADQGRVDPPVLYMARCRVAPRLLHGVLASPEVGEVRHRRWYATLNPVHWFLTLKEIITGWWFCTRPIQFCYSDPGRTNMGGLRDQATYRREVRRALHKLGVSDPSSHPPPPPPLSTATVPEEDGEKEKSKEEKDGLTAPGLPSPAPLSHAAVSASSPRKKHLVLFGVSRGATTCFYTAMKLSAEEARHVSLVVVEAPFDTLQHVIDASSPVPRLLRWFFYSFCDWRGDADEALAYDFNPQEVHLRCPLAFVLSVKDRRVPNACTQALIDRVRRELVPHVIPAVEVLTLQHSRHPCMAVGHKEDQDAYVAFMEDLYNRYCPP